jgi:hypothetical protein
MLRRAAAALARRPALLPPAPALLAPLAIQCLALQLVSRGLAKKAVKEKSGKGGKPRASPDEDQDEDDGAGPAAGGEGPDLDKLAAQMERSVGILLKEYHGMQVGRATPGMLDSLQVRRKGSRGQGVWERSHSCECREGVNAKFGAARRRRAAAAPPRPRARPTQPPAGHSWPGHS